MRRSAVPGLSRPGAAVAIGLLLLAAILLRLAPLAVPHMFFPDEIFQYQEAAHRLVFGPAVIPWEYREHIRSWLMPLLLAGPMWIGGMIAPASEAYLLLPKLLVMIFSLSTLAIGAMLGRRISPLHGWFGLLVGATWVEFVYFSTVTLTEPIAAITFLFGAALFYRSAQPSRVLLAGAGAMLAATCVIRFQYGPAVLIFGLMAVSRSPIDVARLRRECVWLLAGAVPPLALSILVDLLMGQSAFGWLFANIHQNITLQRSHAWVDGPSFYPRAMVTIWTIWLPILLALAIVGARRYPALFVAAIANILIHSMIAHKEYRYILLSSMTIALLAAIGTADVVRWAQHRHPKQLKNLPFIAAVAWLGASASVAANVPVRQWWTQQSALLRAFTLVRETPSYCGMALANINWTGSGGYSYLHRAVPLFLYAPEERPELERDRNQFNAVVIPAGVAVPGYRRAHCWSGGGGSFCVWERPGPCADASSPNEINRKLIRTNS